MFFSFRPCYVCQFCLLILLNHKWSQASFRFYMDLGMNVLIVLLLFHMLDKSCPHRRNLRSNFKVAIDCLLFVELCPQYQYKAVFSICSWRL